MTIVWWQFILVFFGSCLCLTLCICFVCWFLIKIGFIEDPKKEQNNKRRFK